MRLKEKITCCVERGCENRPYPGCERCLEHSRRYYARYWGWKALLNPRGDEDIDYGYFAIIPKKMRPRS